MSTRITPTNYVGISVWKGGIMSYDNTRVQVDGNIIVHEGGSLIFTNCTLEGECVGARLIASKDTEIARLQVLVKHYESILE